MMSHISDSRPALFVYPHPSHVTTHIYIPSSSCLAAYGAIIYLLTEISYDPVPNELGLQISSRYATPFIYARNNIIPSHAIDPVLYSCFQVLWTIGCQIHFNHKWLLLLSHTSQTTGEYQRAVWFSHANDHRPSEDEIRGHFFSKANHNQISIQAEGIDDLSSSHVSIDLTWESPLLNRHGPVENVDFSKLLEQHKNQSSPTPTLSPPEKTTPPLSTSTPMPTLPSSVSPMPLPTLSPNKTITNPPAPHPDQSTPSIPPSNSSTSQSTNSSSEMETITKSPSSSSSPAPSSKGTFDSHSIVDPSSHSEGDSFNTSVIIF
nr:MAG: hypothetical protein [Rhabdoviridae sp.]